MVKEGVMDEVDEIYGLQLYPDNSLQGKIGIKEGLMSPSIRLLNIKIVGKGGHGSNPQKCVNPVPVACEVQLKLNKLVEEHQVKNPCFLCYLPVLQGANGFNVIPEFAEIGGIHLYK